VSDVIFVRCRRGRVSAAINLIPRLPHRSHKVPGLRAAPRGVSLAAADDAPTGVTIAGVALSEARGTCW
jgi:hypothetical protein